MNVKDLEALLVQKQKTVLLYRRFASYIIATALLISSAVFYKKIANKSTLEGKSLSSAAWLDSASLKFMKLASHVENASYCMPLHVDIVNDVEIFFHHCPAEVFAKRATEYEVMKDFVVDARIARRFHFWREVYSNWSSDQFVLHSSEFPEVILETVDVSNLKSSFSSNERRKKAQKVIKTRKRMYRNLLVEMHRKYRKGEAFLSPAMLRIEKTMQHITDKNKYWIVARSIRTQRGQRDFISSGLQASGRYLPAIKKEFERIGVPTELANIAFIESSFNLNAYSKVGAGGIFQIMPATGKQYMIVGDDIDERKDPIKSATAAAKLLKLNYRLTKSWPLAITAYNHGVGGINRAVRSVKSRDIVELIEQYRGNAFGFASKNFYTGFLGLLDTLEKADKIFPNIVKFSELKFLVYRVRNNSDIGDIQKKLNISKDIIRFYNPDLSAQVMRGEVKVPRGYRLKHPAPEEIKQNVASKAENT
ncbi:lytic transglycosylase domain-containing protein [Oligoflexaceae bacterium]|nr:lytic transglycosylase domain-containing protein [Oligoflexaceae bacterium]